MAQLTFLRSHYQIDRIFIRFENYLQSQAPKIHVQIYRNRLARAYVLQILIHFRRVVVVVALLFYVHGKHLRSCRDGELT